MSHKTTWREVRNGMVRKSGRDREGGEWMEGEGKEGGREGGRGGGRE